jgi:hypothetical protein
MVNEGMDSVTIGVFVVFLDCGGMHIAALALYGHSY